jgi:hypothetical protein
VAPSVDMMVEGVQSVSAIFFDPVPAEVPIFDRGF